MKTRQKNFHEHVYFNFNIDATCFSLLLIFIVNYGVLRAQKINVVTELHPPFITIDKDNRIAGSSTEIIQEILQRANIDFTIESYTWARAYKKALDEPNTLIYNIAKSKKREDQFKWGGIIAPYKCFLYKLRSREDIVVDSLEDAKKYTTGVVIDDVRDEYLQNKGFVINRHLEQVNTDSLNILKLMKNRIDLFPADDIGSYYLITQLDFNPNDFEKVILLNDFQPGFYFAFSLQTNDSVVSTCKEMLKELKRKGTVQKILNKYSIPYDLETSFEGEFPSYLKF